MKEEVVGLNVNNIKEINVFDLSLKCYLRH
jgi:hypothetical protein